MKTLTDIPNLEGVTVLLRADFNVPIRNGVVVDDFRIRAAMPTLKHLMDKGARVVMASHLESNDGTNPSLEPVAKKLAELGCAADFFAEYRGLHGRIQASESRCILLENLRINSGEKKNDPAFARELASLADIYVNEAFSVSHREHASIVGVPHFLPSYAGLELEKEVQSLSKAFSPSHPFLFILGGAKFQTKLPLLTKFLDIADQVFVGGALSNDIYRAKGYETGISLISSAPVDLSHFISSDKLLIPTDITNQHGEFKPAGSLSSTDKIMDSGPQTLEILRQAIAKAAFILWNGPLGMYEDGYRNPTLELARMIGEATTRGAETIVGGGDTLAAISELGIPERFTFISTGGGAMLDFLAQGTLPGIEALNTNQA